MNLDLLSCGMWAFYFNRCLLSHFAMLSEWRVDFWEKFSWSFPWKWTGLWLRFQSFGQKGFVTKGLESSCILKQLLFQRSRSSPGMKLEKSLLFERKSQWVSVLQMTYFQSDDLVTPTALMLLKCWFYLDSISQKLELLLSFTFGSSIL